MRNQEEVFLYIESGGFHDSAIKSLFNGLENLLIRPVYECDEALTCAVETVTRVWRFTLLCATYCHHIIA